MEATVEQLNVAAGRYLARKETDKANTCLDLAAKLTKYGDWASEKQARYASNLVRFSDGGSTPTEKLETFLSIKKALDAAHGRGIKRPLIRISVGDGPVPFVFSRAPDNGKNPGVIYAKVNDSYEGTYLGKISPDGTFSQSRDCDGRLLDLLREIAKDPLGAARSSGKLTGACSCCGRQLSDPESIQNGIGPICERKFFGE